MVQEEGRNAAGMDGASFVSVRPRSGRRIDCGRGGATGLADANSRFNSQPVQTAAAISNPSVELETPLSHAWIHHPPAEDMTRVTG